MSWWYPDRNIVKKVWQTDGQTDRRTERSVLRAAWSQLKNTHIFLVYWGRVMHICIRKLGHHWFRQWLVACLATSHYLNLCLHICDWILRHKLWWNFNQWVDRIHDLKTCIKYISNTHEDQNVKPDPTWCTNDTLSWFSKLKIML